MLVEVDSNVFEKVVCNDKEIYFDLTFIEITANVNNLDSIFYIFYDNKNHPVVAFVLYKNGKKIVIPKQYLFYNGIWTKHSLKIKRGRDYLYESLNKLKDIYSEINLFLPIHFTDIRPFIWNDFKINLRYTYVKLCQDQDYEKDALINYKKASELGLSFENNSNYNIDWEIYESQLKSFDISILKIKRLKKWIEGLQTENMIFHFNVNQGTKVIGSGILLNDKSRQKAYFLLRHIPKNEIQKAVNSYLYIEILKYLNSINYETLNYLGANLRSIAEFKSRFKPTLMPNYMVSFKKNTFNFEAIKSHLKKKIVNALNYLIK